VLGLDLPYLFFIPGVECIEWVLDVFRSLPGQLRLGPLMAGYPFCSATWGYGTVYLTPCQMKKTFGGSVGRAQRHSTPI
jgi:hypothetical protein